ncbi:hypothetical protein BMS3Abin07_01755 [bacterium BMS3Abin07]|nr:hypothetical protein BMS3Abin07_01755 [bacterium BMS3Abin07]GBE32707.1 hypothetical protein BMS3Bbin05_01624 [bacterium BMS3Bbin05]HDO22067.1 hypothetical protein [Nitrospirota bacterium]HDZ87683.1 hypothetical protein [Nitrospirota bacterium]
MSGKYRLKRYLIVGAVAGGLLAIAVSLLMDTLFADSLNGTWRDAIVSDLHNFFHMNLTVNSPVVFIVFGIILLILSGFGALLGMIFTFFIIRFFSFLKG